MMDTYNFIGTKEVLGFDGYMCGISNREFTEIINSLKENDLDPHTCIQRCDNSNSVDYDWYPLFKLRRLAPTLSTARFTSVLRENFEQTGKLPYV